MGTAANQIATKKDLYTAFGAFSSASTSRECPTYAEVIAEGLVVSTTLASNRLVKFSLISASTASDPTITVYITNLQAITEYHNSIGIDGDTYFTWSDGSDIDVDLTYNLYYYDGNLYNTITGTLSQWEALYDLISGSDDCCLWNSDWGEVIAGPMYESDCDRLMEAIREAVDAGDSECDFEFPFDHASPSVSPTSVSFASSGGSKVITLNNGVLTNSSESLSWITLSGASTGSSKVTITASKNTTTNSRSGCVYIYVNGTSCPVYVYQSAATVTNINIPVTYSMDGWMSATNTEFDNSLSVTAYNTSTGATKSICSNVNIIDGYGQNGLGDRTINLGTLTIPESELSNWEIRVWGWPRSCSAGYANICFWDKDYRYAACPNLDMKDWGGSLNSPVLKAPLRYIEDYGGCVDIYFWSAAVGGTAPNSNESNAIGGTKQ